MLKYNGYNYGMTPDGIWQAILPPATDWCNGLRAATRTDLKKLIDAQSQPQPQQTTGFAVNDRVHRIKEDQSRHGTIVEINSAGRCRILWDAVDPGPGRTPSNYHESKRTWMAPKGIAKVK